MRGACQCRSLEGLLECPSAFNTCLTAVLIERTRDIAGLIILRSNANPERDFFQRLPVDRLTDAFLQVADAIRKWNDLGALVGRLFLGWQSVCACRECDDALDAVGIKIGEAMRQLRAPRKAVNQDMLAELQIQSFRQNVKRIQNPFRKLDVVVHQLLGV